MTYKPWLDLHPTDFTKRWWFSSDIKDNTDYLWYSHTNNIKDDAICYYIFEENVYSSKFYRFSTWYKNNPNRYVTITYDFDWIFDRDFSDMKSGDIVTDKYYQHLMYKVIETKKPYAKILERIFS